MKSLLLIVMFFTLAGPVFADSGKLNSQLTKHTNLASAIVSETEEEQPGMKQVPPIQNDPKLQLLPEESMTDHPAVIPPPVTDPEMTISPPVTDPEMAINPEELPANPEEEAPVFPR